MSAIRPDTISQDGDAMARDAAPESKALDRTVAPAPGSIRDYTFPAVHRNVHANGMTSLVSRAGGLPLVTAHVVVDAGTMCEGEDAHGIAQLTANSLEGGTTGYAGAELAWALEELGLELAAWTTWDAAHIRVTATSERIEPALRLLADIVQHPSFPQDEVERARDEQLAEILQRAAEPRAHADDMAAQFIFGEGATYGRAVYGTSERVARYTRDEVATFHAARYSPARATVVLAGDIEPARGHALIDAAFGAWQGAEAEACPFVPGTDADATVIHIIDRPGSVQSELRLGHTGVPRSHPDYFAINVMNNILGGAFMSRLNLNLREKHGFTYGVRSGYGFRRQPGPFVIQTAVATDVTARALEETYRELRALLDDGATDEEITNARKYLAGIFPFQLQTTEELAGRIAELGVYGLPDDYNQHYRDDILAVQPADVQHAAHAHVRPDAMAIVIVGDAASLEAPLSALGIGDVRIHRNDGASTT